MSGETDCHRAFGSIIDDVPSLVKETYSHDSVNRNKAIDTLDSLSKDIVGQYQSFITPYGTRPQIYADWTASGRAVGKIENYVQSEILPFYGNTHTTSSISGHQSTCFRHEARQIISESVNAKITGKAAEDVVLFVGNGTTAAVNKLVDSLGLNIPLQNESPPVVFTSSYEHHSNLLPWRESVADVVTIAYHPVTGVCLKDLEKQLIKYKDRKSLKIGAFSAASNVTGLLTAVDEVSEFLHQQGALAFFDYATAAPYVKIDMNPVSFGESNYYNPQRAKLAYKDGIYFSGHKFVGGVGSPGLFKSHIR